MTCGSRRPGWCTPDGRGRSGGPYRIEDDFALGDVAASPSALTPFLLRRLARDGSSEERRRRNYTTVTGRLQDHVPDGFHELPPGAAPHSMPLHVDDRADFVARIQEAGVRAFAFWSHPHPALADPRSYPNASYWRDRAVILPCHQELSGENVQRIADVCVEALGRRRG